LFFGWGPAARGDLAFVAASNHRVLAFTRSYQGQVVLVIANLSRFAQPVELDLKSYAGRMPVEMLGEQQFPTIGQQPYFLSLSPHAFFWFRLDQPNAAPTA
jgi:maltose alpha-D-glucosyltransferase/alpha-amylase